MPFRLVLAVCSAVALLPVVGVGASAASAAPTCPTARTVLALPAGATGGTVTAAVPGLAVGTVVGARGHTRAVQWRWTGQHWVVRQIPGVAALGANVFTSATGVNRHGAITVNARTAGVYGSRAYVAADGVLYPLLDGVRGYDASAEDISDSGRVVGAAHSEPLGLHLPVRWDYWDQVPRGLGYSTGSSSAFAVDVNDDIAGAWYISAHWGGGALRIDGDGAEQRLDLGPIERGEIATATALDLNSSERTVGYGYTPTGSGAFVWDRGERTVLPLFAGAIASASEATGVDEHGTVVGYESTRASSETPLVPHVLFWTDDGGLRTLLPASGRWSDAAQANDVTDNGTVYGSSVARAGSPMQPTVWRCAAQQAFVAGAAS